LTLTSLLDFQLAHSIWALRQLLDHARSLPADAIEQDMGIGPGGVRENLAHTIEAMFFFADNFAGREWYERPDFDRLSRSLDGLRQLLDAAAIELRGAVLGAISRGLGERVYWPNAASGSLPSAAAITQMVDHATLHRAQCINMLKRLGISPVPDLDPMTFHAARSAQ
jgi:uncharacterized damage-inducible protein DinB